MENNSLNVNPKINTEITTSYNINPNINPNLNPNLNLKTNFENPYKFTHENLKYNDVSVNKLNIQNNQHQPNISNKNFFDSNIAQVGTKVVSTAIIADEINKYPKQFGSCMEDIRKEYGNMYSDITGLNARAYCAIKPFTDTVPGVSDFLKYGLDGQARLNHQIFNGKQNNFSALTKMDNELTKVEKYTSDKTLYKITNDYLENNSNNKHNINNDIKLNNHKISNTCTSDILNINKIPDISTSFNNMLNEKSFNNYLSNDLLNNNSLTLNNNICKPIDDIQLINNKVNNSNILIDNQYKTYPLCRI